MFNNKGYITFQVLFISFLITAFIFSMLIYYRSSISMLVFQQNKSAEWHESKSSFERVKSVLSSNVSFSNTLVFSDLKTSTEIEEVSIAKESVVLTPVLDTTTEKTFSFPVYSNDDISFQFSNLPANTSIKVSNTKGFSKDFTGTNVFISGVEIYNVSDSFNNNQYDVFTLSLKTASALDDLSSVTIATSDFTKERVLWVYIKKTNGQNSFIKKIKITNNLTGSNSIDQF